MKIAVAVWEERVSPVFDVSRALRVTDVTPEGAEIGREEVALHDVQPAVRVTMLTDRNVEVLICGAVSAPLAEMIQAAGIRLLPFVAGGADAALAAFLRGDLPSPAYALPGCCGRRRRCRNGRRRGGD